MSIATPVPLPRLELVVARARNGVIGRASQLPWHLPEDLKYFKRLTMGLPILMGRRTWDSIGRPLPGRQNLVLTRQGGFAPVGASVVHGLDEAIAAAGAVAAIRVIGGAEIFRLCLARASLIYLTEVEADLEGDVYFPPLAPGDWQELAREAHPRDARNAYPYSFVTLARRAN